MSSMKLICGGRLINDKKGFAFVSLDPLPKSLQGKQQALRGNTSPKGPYQQVSSVAKIPLRKRKGILLLGKEL
jgi:hypothetical protein